MTAYKRPDYTKIVIDNLKNCIGFKDYLLLARIEPGHPEVERIFKDLPNCEVTINDGDPGCGINTFKIIEKGFGMSDFVVHMEDDTVPGIDSLKYFEWINDRYKDDKNIFTATAYNRVSEIDPQRYFSVNRCQSFTGWMWATWKDRWEEIRGEWTNLDPPGWDHNLNRNIRNGRSEISPVLPRSQNIGAEGGLHATPHIWKKCQRSDIWVNNAPFIQDILLSNILSSSTLSNDNINDLAYFETSSDSCPAECYDPRIAIIGIVGIGYLYLLYKQKKSVDQPQSR